MRILYVTRQYPPHGVGGIGTYVEALAGLMADAGHEVTVLSASPDHERSTDQAGAVTVERFGVLGPAWLWDRLHRRSKVAASRLHAALSAAVAVRRLRARFDVIEAPEWKAEGLLLPWLRRGPVVIHLHLPHELARRWRGGRDRPPRGVRLAEWMERRSVLGARAVTATSELSRTLPDRTRWIPVRTVELVPPPVLVPRWAGLPPVSTTGPVVLFLGHLEYRKGPDVLIEALGILADEVEGLHAVFVGRPFMAPSGIPFDDYIRGEGARAGISCEVMPPQRGTEAMRALYAMARAVAVPSRYETLSMVALEGFAAARPVVMSDAVGAVEWVGSEVPDLVVPSDDPASLAAALRPLLLDGAQAETHGEAGRRAVVAACSEEAIVDQRVAAYRAANDAACRSGRSR